MGNNYVVLFIGWEGVGLCSYLLIGYYYDQVSAAQAATKAFVVNRIGDAGFLIAIFLVFINFKTLDYTQVFAQVDQLSSGTATAIAICLLIGAVGKSAQIAAAHLAARCHGRPHAGQRVHPCRDDGDGRGLHDRAQPCASSISRPAPCASSA